MLRGHLSRKIFIASLLYFMLGKYSLILSTFKCCHKKGKVDETRRYNFRLFQVFFLFFSILFFFFLFLIFNFYFIFLFSALSCYPKPNTTEKMAIDQRSDNKTRLTRYFFIIILLFFIISVFATVFGASGWKASSQSVKCHGQVYPCDEINERDWDVKYAITKTPSETFAYYKCSLGEHSQGCRLTFTRQECDCGNAWHRITDNQDQSRLKCRTCLPNRKSQTGDTTTKIIRLISAYF